MKFSRRDFLKIAAATPVLTGIGGLATGQTVFTGELKWGGEDYSPVTGAKRERIPSACWQCVTRDAIEGYVENGRIVKLEGHSKSIRTRGKLCAKGQGGISQVYDPDRLLYPMKRTGPQGFPSVETHQLGCGA